jgi:hypothetical protein
MASVALVAAGLLAGAVGGSLIKSSQEKGGAADVPLPTRDRPEVDAARKRQKLAAAQQRGRQSTILAGAGGGPNELVSQRTTLLGGVQ